MANDPLIEQLKPVRRRLTLFRLSRMTLLGLLAGSLAGVFVLGVARLWLLLYASLFFFFFVMAGLITGLLFGLWNRATAKEAAIEMDKSVTEDAIVTALEGLEAYGANKQEPAIVKLQREDATEAANRYVSELNKRLPWPSWRSARVMLFGLCAVWTGIAIMLILPNPLQERAVAQAEMKMSVDELELEAKLIEEELERLSLPQDVKEALTKPLDKLREELVSGGLKPVEVLEKLDQAMREIERVANAAKEALQRLNTAAEAMNRQPLLRPLGAALQDRDSAAMEQAVDHIRSSLSRLTPAERKELAETLEGLASQMQEQGDGADKLAAAFGEAARQVRDNSEADQNSGEDALSQLRNQLASELSQGELEQLARSMSEQLDRSGQAIAEGMRSQGLGGSIPPSWRGNSQDGSRTPGGGTSGEQPTSGSNGTSNPGSNGGQGSGSRPDSGQGAESGAGQGNGGGIGSAGSQESGGGVGSGSGQGNESGTGSGNGQGSGNGAGLGAGSRTLVTTPRTMAGSGDVYQDGGPSSGGQIEQGGQSPIMDGVTRPYEEVYSEYAAEARQSLGRSSLPASMQDKVKQYFDEIQPNR
ncbi:hypothetical protein [Paenibacillus paeoniae]|uniref:Uncharacterized protein n=1 Tax=Paenibacillus paeoniae TaxID=2292705 RepID=A0A371PK97_9BACL|nr:hypothetical protein [Paenibacillus paeoniae]REK76604.1 hypothetical protein DX130_06080 [Paenibacillus paeoniae]